MASARRRSRLKGTVAANDTADLKDAHPQRAEEFWRALALSLLDLCSRRDPPLARRVGPLALHYARALEVPDPLQVRGPLLARFQRDLDGLPGQLGRGKGKEPPAISDHGLLELYETLRSAIGPIRRLEHAGKGDEVAQHIVNRVFGCSPFPAGREKRDAAICQLAASSAGHRVSAFLAAAARWAGLPDPNQRALDLAFKHFVVERAPGETAILILTELVGATAKTITNRLNLARRALRGVE